MQTGYTGFVDRSEWRWTTLVSITFILFTFSPFVIITLYNPIQSGNQFMGALHDFADAATHIARMKQGEDGQLLTDFLYSSQEQGGALVHPLYALLGQLVRYSQLSATIMFHVLRIFVSLFMYMTIYHLGANIWVKVRTRRIFFILASAGAGFGWFIALFTGTLHTPDLTLPQAFPLYATAANIHYPMAIACVALIVSVIIAILRPGVADEPSAENSGGMVFIASLVLAFVYPDALIPLGIAYALNVAINWYIQKKFTRREWYWGLWILVPALPVVTYDLITVINNDFVSSWINQRGDSLPSILMLILSFGIPLIIAIPGIIRAVRRFEPDGDRFMLLWLLAMIITAYLPLQLKQYLLLGVLIPVAYFATRSVEDFWFNFIRRIHRPKVYVAIFPLIVLSHLLWAFLPIYPLIFGWDDPGPGSLERDYGFALAWMDQNERIDNESIILAAPDVSLWIPAWTGSHVVYGHPAETFNATETENAVREWYQQTDPAAEICQALIEEYRIDYVVFGERERNIGAGACIQNLTQVNPHPATDSLRIYATQYAGR